MTTPTMKEWRNQKNITQEELARETGISYSSILAYDNGYRMPPVDKAIKIAQYIGVPVEKVDWRLKNER